MTTNRVRTAWKVLRKGLPVVEISHRIEDGRSVVEVVYSGRCHGFFDGDLWTDDGTFSVVLTEPLDALAR